MKPTRTLFKHYCIEINGSKGSTTMRFKTRSEALAFKKGVMYTQVYSEYNNVYVSEIFVDYLSIKLYDID